MASAKRQFTRNADIPAIVSTTLHDVEATRVSSALDENRMTLFFQPIVRSDSNKFVAFYEGLARIIMPDGSVVSAGQFMPFVENSKLGTRVDRYVLRRALQHLEEYSNIRLSINLCVLSMNDSAWLSILEDSDSRLCDRLIIEITESTAMSDVDSTTAFLHRVRRKGCSIALDDFGVGATSFRYFKDFLFDFVKIDGMFIRDLRFNKDNQVLVRALVDISQHFEMVTVAEFVETDGDAKMATKLGIDCLQGYLIGEPASLPVAPYIKDQLNRYIAG